jgi:cell division septum initiation protein DivIVA
MSYEDTLAELETMIEEARSVPLSASAVIPREEALRLVRELKEKIPGETAQAREIVVERERVLTEAHEKASFIVEQAREERSRLLSKAEVVQAADDEGKRIVEDARAEAQRLAHEADDWADAKLANLEIILDKLLRTMAKGRERLHRRMEAHTGEIEPLELDDSGEFSGPIETIEPQQ